MELTFSNEFEYIPNFAENKKSEKPVVIHCRYMTMPERSRLIEESMISSGGEIKTRTVFHNSDILKTCILKIENLKVNGVEIKTAKEMIAIEGLSQMCEEVATYIATQNLIPDLKN